MAQTLSNFDAVLKEFYEGAVRETVNNQVQMFRVLDESDREWAGRHVRFPLHTQRNSGVGARGESGTLPTAGNQAYSEVRISATYQYGRVQFTGQVIAAGKNAFVGAAQAEMQGLVDDLTVDLGRQTWGVGDGRIAQVGADGASASAISLFNRFQKPGQPGGRYLTAGQSIDLGTVASPTAQASSQAVVSVALSSNPATTVDTLTISDSTVTVSQSDTFVFNRGAGGSGVEMMGIQGLIDVFTESNIWGSNAFAGTTIQNVNRQTVAAWNATILGNSQTERIIDGNLMQVAFDKIHTDTGKEADMIMGHHEVVRAFLDSVSGDRRYVTNGPAPKFDGGHSGLSYNGVAIERDRLAPFNSLLIFNKMALKMYTLLDLEWADDDGSILSRVSNQDSYEAYMRCYKNIGLDANPKLAVMIRDIKTDL